MKVVLVLLLLPLLACWLWLPLQGLERAARRRRLVASLAIAALMPLLVLVWRLELVGYALLSWLQVIAGGVLVPAMLLLVFVAVRDAGWLLHAGLERLLRWPPGIGLRRWHAPWLTQGAVVVALLLGVLGVSNGLRLPQVREQELAIAGLPAELDGLRIAVLADLHLSPVKGAARSRAIVARTLAARPDLVVLPGDMVDGPVAVSGRVAAPLAGLHAPLGVWLAPGNHEVYHDYAAWMDFFARLGLPVLENRAVRIEHNGAAFALSGLGDLAARRPSARAAGIPAPDLPATLAQLPADARLHVVLAHQPRLARELAASGRVDLQLAGHTHGGHLLGMDRWLVAPANDGYVRGRYDVDDMALFVSAGAGQWDGFSARLGVPARIDLLVLRAAPASG